MVKFYRHWSKLFIVVTVLLGLTLASAGCGGGKSATSSNNSKDKIVIRFAGTLPVEHHITKAQELFKKLVEERSNGRVVVQVYPASQLYKDIDMVDVIPKGALEMGVVNLGQFTGLIPQVGIFDVHQFYKDQQHYYRVQDDPQVMDIFNKAMGPKGMRLLTAIDYGQNTFISKKPILTLADFKGMKIRTSSEYQTVYVTALGAGSSLISASEVYQALQAGTIDGAISGPSSFTSRKTFEVAKHDMKNWTGSGNFGLVVNLKWWNNLPPDVKDIIDKAAKEAQAWARQASQQADLEAWKQLESTPGNNVYTVSEDELARWAQIVIPAETKVLKERVGKDADILLERIEATRSK